MMRFKQLPVLLILTVLFSAAAGVTERVSVSDNEQQADGASFSPAISADGRFVAFESAAANLVSGDDNGVSDIFVRDRVDGVTERVSVSSDEVEAGGGSNHAALSADGRFVAFESTAANLVSGDDNGVSDIFVRDRADGTTERISISSAGTQAGGASLYPVISADGRFVAFSSYAVDLAAGDSNGVVDVFVRDRLNGTTERISVASDETQANGPSFGASISADGRFVAFASEATNLVGGDTNLTDDIFVRDRADGTTERVSVSSSETQANGRSSLPSISNDGGFVAFASLAANLVAGDSYANNDIFVRDLANGITRRVSIANDHTESVAASLHPSISTGGRFVAFHSFASNLVDGDINGAWDVFVRDTLLWSTERISVSSAGVEAAGHSMDAVISPDGRYAAFHSTAGNLIDDDDNGEWDVFGRERQVITPIFQYLPLLLR